MCSHKYILLFNHLSIVYFPYSIFHSSSGSAFLVPTAVDASLILDTTPSGPASRYLFVSHPHGAEWQVLRTYLYYSTSLSFRAIFSLPETHRTLTVYTSLGSRQSVHQRTTAASRITFSLEGMCVRGRGKREFLLCVET